MVMIRRSGADTRQDQDRGGQPVADRRRRDVAVTELCGKLGLIEALDEAMGPVKQRGRGFTGGQVLAGMAAAQLAGEDFLVGLDRVRADAAGQQVTPVPGLATSTAAGIARRFTGEHWRGTEAGLAAATARMTDLLPAERAAELAEGPVTIDIDATDVEVYGSKKRGVAYTYQGQRAGAARGVLGRDRDPAGRRPAGRRPGPPLVRGGPAGPGAGRAAAGHPGRGGGGRAEDRAARRRRVLRRGPGPRRRRGGHGLRHRRQADHQHVEGAGRDRRGRLAGRDRHGHAQVAVSPYKPADWPDGTALLVRRVKLDPEQVSADPRSRRRRTLHPDQRALPIPELEQEPAIYAYSFICTNMDVSTPARAAAVEHWYRHRTSTENIFRDTKHGAALRHLPSGYEQVNTAWMWASLIATAVAAWLHQLTGLDLRRRAGGRPRRPRRQGHDRHLAPGLIATPARLVRHGGQLIMRLAPGAYLLPASWPRSAPCQPPRLARRTHHPHPAAATAHRPPAPARHGPDPQKDPESANPARHRAISCPQQQGRRSRSTTRRG